MTEIDWSSDPDLLKRLVLPRGFPRCENGLPDPVVLGMSHRQLVGRYMPRRGRRLEGPEEEVMEINGRLQIIPLRDRFMDRVK